MMWMKASVRAQHFHDPPVRRQMAYEETPGLKTAME
jgi:hypothetical protein